jgi:hypothetical protein
MSSELMTNSVSSAVIRRQIHNAVKHSLKRSEFSQVEVFQQEVLKGRAVREAINRKERTIVELIQLIDRGRKFREWVVKLPEDTRLIAEYINDITADTWADKLPAKALRYLLFTGGGVLASLAASTGTGTALGLTLSGVDSFLVDKFLRGWKPNQFVNDQLAPFVNVGPYEF